MSVNFSVFSFWVGVRTRCAAAGADLVAEYKDGPVAFSLSALILLGAVTCAVVLGMAGKTPALFNAAIHILPAVILAAGNLRRPAPHPDRWPRWLVITGMVVAATVILSKLVEFGLVPDFVQLFVNWLSDVTLAPAILILILTLLLPALTLLANGLKRIPVLGTLLGRWLPAPVLYVLLLAGWNGTMLFTVGFGRSEIWVFGFLATATLAMAIGFRNSLFQASEDRLPWRLLPHVPAWLFGSLGLLFLKEPLGFEEDTFGPSIAIAICLLTLILPPVLATRRLRREPVTALIATGAARPDSIQSKVDHYVDVNGQSARLVKAVGRSDAGVFGVTGVRGAGKSALTRHVLATLTPRYFTLEVTAPVRHDPGLGFFVSVCKAVCGKTLDALEPIVTGARATNGEMLWDKLRNPLLMVFAVLSAMSLLTLFASSPLGSGQPAIQRHGYIKDSLLLESIEPDKDRILKSIEPDKGPIQESFEPGKNSLIKHIDAEIVEIALITERLITFSLLNQIARIIDEEAAGHGSGGSEPAYLLVPAPSQKGFWLLPALPDTSVVARLSRYKESLGNYPNTFAGFHRATARFIFDIKDDFFFWHSNFWACNRR